MPSHSADPRGHLLVECAARRKLHAAPVRRTSGDRWSACPSAPGNRLLARDFLNARPRPARPTGTTRPCRSAGLRDAARLAGWIDLHQSVPSAEPAAAGRDAAARPDRRRCRCFRRRAGLCRHLPSPGIAAKTSRCRATAPRSSVSRTGVGECRRPARYTAAGQRGGQTAGPAADVQGRAGAAGEQQSRRLVRASSRHLSTGKAIRSPLANSSQQLWPSSAVSNWVTGHLPIRRTGRLSSCWPPARRHVIVSTSDRTGRCPIRRWLSAW